jgi:Flp pilus assembly protein TadG
MKVNWVPKPLHRLRARVRRLPVDTRGVAAVEFAMLLPLMLMIFFGTIQISSAVAVDRKVSLVARTLSDLISQASTVTDTDLNNAFATGLAIMSPYASAPLQAVVSEIYVYPTTLLAKVKWSKGSNASAHACNQLMTLPTALQVPSSYLIMSEVTYNYQPVVGFDITTKFVSTTFPLSDQMYTRPRNPCGTGGVCYPTQPSCPL